MINISNNKVIILERMPEENHIKWDTGNKSYRQFLDFPLNAIQDEQSSLWRMQYNHPAKLPPTLQGLQFTTFTALKNFAESYFKLRNMRIKQVINVEDKKDG